MDVKKNKFVAKKKLIKNNLKSTIVSQKMKIETTKITSFMALSDIVSLLNMLSGFLSIILSINGYLEYATISMFFSLLFDSVDGWVARQTNRNDQYGFGKNIDSLSDVVSFGVAPAILLYSISKTIPNSPEILVIGVCMLMVVCGVLRLTRYNAINDHINFKGFIGFPIPGISVILGSYYLTGMFNIYAGMILMVITSLFMISDIKYEKVSNIPLIAFGAILIVLLILPFPIVLFNINIPALLLLIICLYCLLSCLLDKL